MEASSSASARKPGEVRRIVTGFNAEAKSVIVKDTVLQPTDRKGNWFNEIWTTTTSPADVKDPIDGRDNILHGLTMPDGTVIRYVDCKPGTTPMHMTRSLDYAFLIEGEMELLLDDGSVTVLDTPGDVVVQRGTNHAWRTPEGKRAKMMFMHIDAKKFYVNDIVVNGTGFRKYRRR